MIVGFWFLFLKQPPIVSGRRGTRHPADHGHPEAMLFNSLTPLPPCMIKMWFRIPQTQWLTQACSPFFSHTQVWNQVDQHWLPRGLSEIGPSSLCLALWSLHPRPPGGQSCRVHIPVRRKEESKDKGMLSSSKDASQRWHNHFCFHRPDQYFVTLPRQLQEGGK